MGKIIPHFCFFRENLNSVFERKTEFNSHVGLLIFFTGALEVIISIVDGLHAESVLYTWVG